MRGACSTSATLIRFAAPVLLESLYRFDLYLSNRFVRSASRASAQPTGTNKQERRHGLVILKSSLRQRCPGRALLALTLFVAVVVSAPAAHARTRHSDGWAREHFAAAERMREALNGRPPADRSRRDYQRVLNAYRSVYLGAPASSKADPSVVAVAETLVEMGRLFDDDKILNEAIAQYKFLRREYPGSRYRCDALFTIGEIYKDDLNDPAQARVVFDEFLHRYPHNRLAEDAQQAIVELDRQAAADRKASRKKGAKASPALNSDKGSDRARDSADTDESPVDTATTADNRAARVSRVTAIRHWSTPDYTRVA